jgi:hypothetical protein
MENGSQVRCLSQKDDGQDGLPAREMEAIDLEDNPKEIRVRVKATGSP